LVAAGQAVGDVAAVSGTVATPGEAAVTGCVAKSRGPARVLSPRMPLTSPPARSAGKRGLPVATMPVTPAAEYRPNCTPRARAATPALAVAETTNGDGCEISMPCDPSHDSAAATTEDGGPNWAANSDWVRK
jgi:hypothetical protein